MVHTGVLGVGQIAVCNFSLEIQGHVHVLRDLPLNVHGHILGRLAFHHEGIVGNVSGEGDVVGQLPLPRLINAGQVRRENNIGRI